MHKCLGLSVSLTVCLYLIFYTYVRMYVDINVCIYASTHANIPSSVETNFTFRTPSDVRSHETRFLTTRDPPRMEMYPSAVGKLMDYTWLTICQSFLHGKNEELRITREETGYSQYVKLTEGITDT